MSTTFSPDWIEQLASAGKTYKELIAILQKHVGETGENEDAIEVLNRLLIEHRCPLQLKGKRY